MIMRLISIKQKINSILKLTFTLTKKICKALKNIILKNLIKITKDSQKHKILPFQMHSIK